MRFVVSKEAQRDITLIFDYWAQRVSFEIADRIVNSIFDRFALIAKFPEIGRHSDHVSEGLLRVIADNHVIYYRKLRRNVRIVRVIHGARDQGPAFSEK